MNGLHPLFQTTGGTEKGPGPAGGFVEDGGVVVIPADAPVGLQGPKGRVGPRGPYVSFLGVLSFQTLCTVAICNKRRIL